jgi:signal transduction histidine kinase
MNMSTVRSTPRSEAIQAPVRKFSPAYTRLFECLSEFCRCYKAAQIPVEIRKVVGKTAGFELNHLHLNLDGNNGNSLPIFANMSLFEPADNVCEADITCYPEGIEIYCPIADLDDQTGSIRLGLGLSWVDKDHRRKVLEMLAEAFMEETGRLLVPLAMKRNDFLSKLVHQIRNPLATIIIAASQIEMKAGPDYDEDDRMLLGFINTEAERIEHLLAKYSKYTHADSLIKDDFDLAELIRQIGKETSLADFENIKIDHDKADSTPSLRINADRVRLNEALVQILENCLESFQEGPGQVRISLGRESESAKISIYDNGPGIRPELLRKVKEPFFSTKDGGSGLGLAIACKTVSAHGGRLTIDSVEGSRTEVCIELPCK